MKILTICFGILLTLLGVIYYNALETARFFDLMPAIFGILITLFGVLQGKWEHSYPLYGSLLLAFLTFLGSLRALFNLFTVLGGGPVAEPTAVIVRSIIGLSCVIFIGLGLTLIKDFWHGWKAFGQFLGDWLARVVLTVFYFSILIPFGIGVRLFGDPLHIKSKPDQLWRPRQTGDQILEETMRQF
jgi:hypothetical protein